jgi:4-hydroxyacetophenone monooxygenase
VFATGFHSTKMLWPMEIRGRSGITLADAWGPDDARAYLGITVPGFPNFFCLYGPNTNLAFGGSIIFHSECQTHYVMSCLRELIEGGHEAMEVSPEAHDDYNARLDDALGTMIWSTVDVNSWYRNDRRRVVTNSPWRLIDYWRMTKEPVLDDYAWTAPGR